MSLKQILLNESETPFKNKNELIKTWKIFCEAVNDNNDPNEMYISHRNREGRDKPPLSYSSKIPFILNMLSKYASRLFSYRNPLERLIEESGIAPNTKYLEEYVSKQVFFNSVDHHKIRKDHSKGGSWGSDSLFGF